ncbi:Aste57867_19765 [Aphanomyces stellatus]|uniref:Aste57867_19765 protein n=1 Tax=Aphanomyces stellatus TaxID=120398 RepID=A0A485LDW2_9STRA|nr:hypothetical protein As57867_019700 [Aphanomyces stellatus]VFT96463.1 Aste57867_19765 [Aphanomyces stellatus]
MREPTLHLPSTLFGSSRVTLPLTKVLVASSLLSAVAAQQPAAYSQTNESHHDTSSADFVVYFVAGFALVAFGLSYVAKRMCPSPVIVMRPRDTISSSCCSSHELDGEHDAGVAAPYELAAPTPAAGRRPHEIHTMQQLPV